MSEKGPKFDEIDRKRVVRELENVLGKKLSTIGRRRIYLQDQEGSRYVVIGGFKDWHGMPDEIIEYEMTSNKDSYLIIAKESDKFINIYMGSLKQLTEKCDFYVHSNGEKSFLVEEKHGYLQIPKAGNLTLRKLARIDYSEAHKKDDVRIAELRKTIEKLPREALEKFIKDASSEE
jgi:hypothetical protein